MIIDPNWEIEYQPNNVVLIEIRASDHKKAKGDTVRVIRGYYAHIDEALQAYLRKSINPVDDVREVLAKIDWALEMIVKYKKKKENK